MRPPILNPLFAAVDSIKGIGPKLMKPLDRLNIATLRDLIFHLPNDYRTRHHLTELDEAYVGQYVVLDLLVTSVRESAGRGPTRILAQDDLGNVMALVFFGRNGGWARRQLPANEKRRVSGRLDRYGDMLQIVHPDHIGPVNEAVNAVEPIYPLAEGLTAKKLHSSITEAMADVPELPEWIEPGLHAREQWPAWRDALQLVHQDRHDVAQSRLAYDEIFAGQLAFALLRKSNRRQQTRPRPGDKRLTDALELPYSLTGAQIRSISEIAGDMASETPMLRLLQGDVGSGKTVVAVMAMLQAIESGGQAVLLAPTEILARQHYDGISEMLRGLPVEVDILTGRDKGKAREAKLMGIADGSIQLIIGTHAVFQDAVLYHDLALAVIDEQHRFGVNQRLLLAKKGKAPPHMLTMTATPIPRTLTLSQFGEMDVSRLDEKPPGRQPIETLVLSENRLDELANGLARHIDGGGQAYWVCPLVNDSEQVDAVAVETRFAMLQARFGEKVGLVHGQMPAERKDAEMERFVAGETQILCATTVIEVGVNVPNATLMIIESAERYGLAQLHQLRGRVGRGSDKSRCLLLRGDNLSETGRERLALMRSSQDGFHLAEEDLRLRGAGELLGTRQSGDVGYRLATPEQVHALIGTAHDDARLLTETDPDLQSERGEAARVALYLFERDYGVRLLRGG
ncbi:MAG: ATP-dependent DNA helicase RecG [Pseudomonadota bacterium]